MGVPSKLAALLAILSPLALGCSAAPSSAPAAPTVEQARAASALGRLSPRLADRPVQVSLDRSDHPGAYAWPDGRLLLTRGLVRLLDDEELAAAVAHELGHLVSDGHARTVAALGGTGPAGAACRDAESRADAAGVQLLSAAGCDPEAMPRMLEKVAAAPGMSKARRESLRRRSTALRSSLRVAQQPYCRPEVRRRISRRSRERR